MKNTEITNQAWSAPRLREASEDPNNPSGQYLTIDRIYGISGETLNCDVSISSGMQANDIVRVRGQYGSVTYDAPEFRLSSPPVGFSIAFPKFMLYGSSGASLNLNFALRKQGGGDWLISQSRYVRIERQALELQAPALPLGSRTLEVQYTGMTSGHTVRARLFSSATQYFDTQEVVVDNGRVYIVIPHSWFVANNGKTVWINYAVKRSGDSRRIFSRLLYIERLQAPSNA
ncbi:hypothetical protein [Pseudomonas sp. UM16]|uniref:hypothetical protein n=1 Tax=Pseudomonas sp. UM16 TaxID=3158962 RepID=UPI0039900F9C